MTVSTTKERRGWSAFADHDGVGLGAVIACADHDGMGLGGLSMADEMGGWVYIMTNQPNGVLYVGVTSDLVRRVFEHREEIIEGFTKRYGLKRLVWFERHETILGGDYEGEGHKAVEPGLEGPVDRGG